MPRELQHFQLILISIKGQFFPINKAYRTINASEVDYEVLPSLDIFTHRLLIQSSLHFSQRKIFPNAA